MANRHRGEIEAELGGKRRKLCLTLGALAELETALGVEDLSALAERFGSGRISARDAIRVIGAGLRGVGEEISDEETAQLASADAAAGYVRVVVDLLSATFGVVEKHTPQNPRLP
ncbi:MAG: gene transfer agent family protein [Xanthobacteraceae bacterium]